MSKLPHLALYPADFFADTAEMRPEAAKSYLFLLCHAWLRGARLQDDDDKLARLARLSKKAWLGMRSEVLAKFDLGSDGFWRQGRLTREYGIACRKAEDNRKNGSLGGQAKSAKKHNGINGADLANAKQHARATPEPEPELEPERHYTNGEGVSTELCTESELPLESPNPTRDRCASSDAPTSAQGPPKPKSRGTRIGSWEPNQKLLRYAVTQGIARDQVRCVFDDFRDHFLAKAGPSAVKMDWGRAWQLWVRREARGDFKANGATHVAKAPLSPIFTL